MTRRETIEQQAKSYTLAVFDELEDFSDVTQAYIDGAEWMQETMIEKACEILKNVTVTYNRRFFGKCEENIFDADFIKEFRKAMEE